MGPGKLNLSCMLGDCRHPYGAAMLVASLLAFADEEDKCLRYTTHFQLFLILLTVQTLSRRDRKTVRLSLKLNSSPSMNSVSM